MTQSDLLALLFSVTLLVLFRVFFAVLQHRSHQYTTTEWITRMRELGLGVRLPTSRS